MAVIFFGRIIRKDMVMNLLEIITKIGRRGYYLGKKILGGRYAKQQSMMLRLYFKSFWIITKKYLNC